MIRKAFRMSVHAESQEEYARRHNPIWEELQDAVESEERWQAIASTEACQRWWRHMRELMPSRPDGSPSAG